MGGIAILGNADSFWLQRFVNNVTLPLRQEFTIISAQNEKYRQYYADNNIHVITTRPKVSKCTNTIVSKLRAFETSLNTLRAIKSVNPDVVHVHYAYPYILKLLPYIRSNVRTIVTFWGSDLLRAGVSDQDLIRKTADSADALVVGAEDLFDKLHEINTSVLDKTSVIRMGITAFDSIDKRRDKAAEAKRTLLGVEFADRTVITVGYNAGRAQQHINSLRSIATLPNEMKDSIAVILPLTYQNDDTAYLKELEEYFADTGIRGIMLKEFMNDEEIATLCLATDIFINGQTTDAISASMLEQLYSGSLVINGKWLNYRFLDDNGIEYEQFSDFDSLRDVLYCAIKSVKNGSIITSKNADILKESFSWEASRKKWKSIYEAMINQYS